MSSWTKSTNRAALAAVCLSALMLGLEISSIPAILPNLEQVLPADFRQLQWIMNAYTIAMTACLMAMGALADRYGRKLVFMAGIFVFGLASLACGLATSAPILIAARFVQGASAAAMLSCQIAVLSHQFRGGAERGSAFGWWGIVFGFGLGFGPLIGGLTVAVASWEWVFLVHVGLAGLALALTKSGVSESSDPHAERVDWPGMATLFFAVFALVYLITQGQVPSFANPTALTLALVGCVSLLAFVVVEKLSPRPMFDFDAFRNRAFSGALLSSVGMNFSFWPFVIYLPIYFGAVQGLDSARMGLALLAYTVPTFLVPPLGERLLIARGPRFVIPLGLFAIGVGFVLMRLGTGSSWLAMLPGCVVAGIGLGLTNTPVTNTATAAVPAERAGMASGMDMSARIISLAINIALMGFLLLEGIRASLERLAPEAASTLAALSEAIAAGNLTAAETGGLSRAIARQALVHGFEAVMLYGAATAFGTALLAVLVLRGWRTRSAADWPARSVGPDRSPD
ncbi:MFS transporter [Methylobacterium gossipiicola]|uniref:Drug resistance transporter, EmrB/QacA subfamily n=1 Tax=Methylobacterium gossipiicola TaxID=582675 RepID=A0A1I2TB05_9HYPH|nr:MFS transporter [Methylobacterium gossipiicola]SFG59481.1 drug resistance transporter, EmrB/QacA subfamily [Methylobacterium gossipiicola]